MITKLKNKMRKSVKYLNFIRACAYINIRINMDFEQKIIIFNGDIK